MGAIGYKNKYKILHYK